MASLTAHGLGQRHEGYTPVFQLRPVGAADGRGRLQRSEAAPGERGGGALEESWQLRVVRRQPGAASWREATRSGVRADRRDAGRVGDGIQTNATCRLIDRPIFHLQTFCPTCRLFGRLNTCNIYDR